MPIVATLPHRLPLRPRRARTTLAAVGVAALIALAILTAIGWRVLQHPYGPSAEPRPATLPTRTAPPSR